MSDNINITDQVNVSVVPNTTNISVCERGIQGASSSSVGSVSGSTDIAGLISTGDADLRYLASGSSGYFYPWSNPNNYIKSGETVAVGSSVLTGYLPFIINAYNIPSGNDTFFIEFSPVFEKSPFVIGSLINNSGELNFSSQISGISSGGFYLNLSETINSTNYSFHYFATTGSGFLNFGLGQEENLTGTYYQLAHEERIKTEIPSGVDQLFISYDFNPEPMVWSNIQTTGEILYYVNSTAIGTGGYTAIFSDTIAESGIFIHSLIKRV